MDLVSLEGMNTYIEEQMKAWKVPGLSVAVVKDQEIVMMEGYGYRNVDQNLPVTSDTIFAIGSSTKAFTALSAGIMADEGVLDLDAPVKKYLPGFKMFDQYATERITVRDMLCHRTGLPRHELMWYNTSMTREDIIERLRFLEPNTDFRTKWQYQNIMYMVAGYIVGHVNHSSWEEVVQKRILNPLNMSSSQFTVALTPSQQDYALPYKLIEDKADVIGFRNIDTMGPAGSINSNIKDMANWVRFQMNKGMYNGQRIVSNEMLDTMHEPHMICGMSGINENNTNMGSSGLGWSIEPYRGLRMVYHGGNIDGFTAHVAFVPAEKIGVVVLSNLNATPLPVFIANYIFDHLLRGEVRDWSGHALAHSKEVTAATESATINKESSEVKDRNISSLSSFQDLLGTYVHPGYGKMTVKLLEGELWAELNSLLFPLTYHSENQFELHVIEFDIKTKATFHLDSNGKVDRLSVILLMEPGTKEVEFCKQSKE